MHGFGGMKPKKALMIIALLIAAALAVYLISGLLVFEAPEEERSALPEVAQRTWRGEQYRARSGLTTLLLLGIDAPEVETGSAGGRNGHQADFLFLLIFDARRKTVQPVQIDRDTVAEITVTNVMGKPVGTREGQICLSYAFGTTAAEGSRYAKRAVETLLDGAWVDHYMAMGLSGIGRVNDAAGGVTVTVVGDLSRSDPALTPGAVVKLDARQAELFVRARRRTGGGTNAERMERQRVYMEAFRKTLTAGINKGREKYLDAFFSELDGLLEKDVSNQWMVDLLWKARGYTWLDVAVPGGEHTISELGWTEFHADAEQLEEMVIEFFYEPVSA